MKSFFSAGFFAGNRARLRELLDDSSPIVITANGQLQRSGDNTYGFRQDSNFWYLTGIDEPELILVMDKQSEYLIVPERDAIVAMFDGEFVPEELTKRSGIQHIYDQKKGWQKLKQTTRNAKQVASLIPAPAYIERLNFYTNPARTRLMEQLQQINSKLTILDLREQFVKMRIIKQPEELAALQKAIDITTSAIKKLSLQLHTYKYAYEVEADLTYEFSKAGADGHAFDPVIATGAHTAQLHYMSKRDALQDGPVLLDVGAEVENYAADITRIYPIKPFNKRQQKIYEAVLDVQKYAMSLLKPGIAYDAYEKQVEQYMGEKLKELGLIKKIDRDNVRTYFPSMTSHFLGLDVHDIGNRDQIFEAGMILTVEPGIYIPDENFGVRIEDDLLITLSGSKILSDALPRSLI